MSLNLQPELHARNVGKFEGQNLENRHKVPLPSSLRILTFGSLALFGWKANILFVVCVFLYVVTQMHVTD